MNEIKKHLELIRTEMKTREIDLYIIPDTDPHGSEYAAPYWQFREWVSGFTGSYGFVVVGMDMAGLWTDSRYYLAAEESLKGTTIDLFKEGLPGVDTWAQWVTKILKTGQKAGVDGRLLASDKAGKLENELKRKGVEIDFTLDLAPLVWKDRPFLPQSQVELVSSNLIGQERKERITKVREQIKSKGADFILLTALDQIAWTLNIRGKDVDYNPVVVSYLIITQTKSILFTDQTRLGDSVNKALNDDNIEIMDYEKLISFMQEDLKTLRPVVCDFAINKFFFDIFTKDFEPVFLDRHPVLDAKAVKTVKELESTRSTMEVDGVAMVKFLCWLEEEMVRSRDLTEESIAKKLRAYRAESEDFVEESFAPIVGFGSNGAIVHYHIDPKKCAVIEKDNLILIDSGGQYKGGTTDITRTVSTGIPSLLQREDYTRVLKGHIQLARAVFPEETRGYQLDILARQPLWNDLLNYGHGTGHGVGFYLNVHEGPARISTAPIDEPLKPGMILSNEPGVYRKGKHGIRIENLVTLIPAGDSEMGKFYQFETLTLCPLENRLIEKSLLNDEEIQWINQYHQKVYTRLKPLLDKTMKSWLKVKTRAI